MANRLGRTPTGQLLVARSVMHPSGLPEMSVLPVDQTSDGPADPEMSRRCLGFYVLYE